MKKHRFQQILNTIGRTNKLFIASVFVFAQLLVPLSFVAQAVAATVGEYAAQLTSPYPPEASDSFTWEISGEKPGTGKEISHILISGCWLHSDVISVAADYGDGTPVPSEHIEVFDDKGDHGNPDGSIKVDELGDNDLPVTISVVFAALYPSDGAANVFVKTGDGPDAGFNYSVGGPKCDPAPEPEIEISPIVECSIFEDGVYTIFWGYENRSTFDGEQYVVSADEVTQSFTGGTAELPEEFGYPNVVDGRQGRTAFDQAEPNAFVTTLSPGETQVRTLDGRTATASQDTKMCPGATLIVEKFTLPLNFNQDFEFTLSSEGNDDFEDIDFTLNSSSETQYESTFRLDSGVYNVSEG